MLGQPVGILDSLPLDQACIGAVFTSFGFSPPFFEERVLRSVLRLTSDPQEQALRFHYEAQRALQETPVAVFVDAHQRSGGRRLPYDLIEISSRVFHPKAVLLLYSEVAILQVSSANLTTSGYEHNAELVFRQELSYADLADAEILRSFDAHLERVQGIARQTSGQLVLVREELGRRLPAKTQSVAASPFLFCDSTLEMPIFEQLAGHIPKGAKVSRIGLLAPFYERDDTGSKKDDGALDGSIFGALAGLGDEDTALDVGVLWRNAPNHCESSQCVEFEDALGQIWAWSYLEDDDDDESRVVSFVIPTKVTSKRMSYLENDGSAAWHELADAQDDLEKNRLWPVPKPEVYAPAATLGRAREVFSGVRLWLHPAAKLHRSLPISRPLHGKLLVINYELGREIKTLVMLGSANMSRTALLLASHTGANVELSVAFTLEGEHSLVDFCPDLVLAPVDAPDLEERVFPELETSWALLIEQAIYDSGKRTLTIQWNTEHERPAREWRIQYLSKDLYRGLDVPDADTRVADFELSHASAELVLLVDDVPYSVPIIVSDLVALPPGPAMADIGLQELLLLMGKRIGLESVSMSRHKTLAMNGEGDDSTSVFGANFTPTDVFRAWWSMASQLSDATLSLPGFRLQIDGVLGVRMVWGQLRDEGLKQDQLSKESVWFFGVELIKELRAVNVADGPNHNEKIALLASFTLDIERDVAALVSGSGAEPWLQRLTDFYSEKP